MNQETKKLIYRKLDIIWRIIGGFLLILLVYSLIKYETVSDTLWIVIFCYIIAYAIISAIIFLPPILIKFFKRLRKN